MAKGDTVYSRLSRGGYGRYNHYDDEGRGDSKYFWEEFESWFEAKDYSQEWLMGTNCEGVDPTIDKLFKGSAITTFLGGPERSLMEDGLYDGRLYAYIQSMRDRYGVHDWAWDKFEDYEGNDGRMRRLIVKKLGVDVWAEFQERAYNVWRFMDQKRKQAEAEKADEQEQLQAVYDAERVKRLSGEVQDIKKDTELIAGAIRSDFETAFSLVEIHGQDEGDWLDDPIAGTMSGRGFGEEVRRKSGIKLQVTVSLDLSNSMKSNYVADHAARAFRDIYLALEQLKEEHPDDLFICAFTFANNGYRPADRGRRAYNMTVSETWKQNDKGEWGYVREPRVSTEVSLGAVEKFRKDSGWHFAGEDTWLYPLFEEIERWENKDSEAGAVKLDIIITDAVLEHPSDIRRSDVIQARRDGNLQTVMLNFLPSEDWVDSDLPLYCVQYEANRENIAGMLRNLLTEFVSVYL